MIRVVLLLLAFLAAPALASTGRSTTADYVRARLAEANGALGQASAGYAAALDAMPGDADLARRTYRQALAAGDRALALKAARLLDSAGKLPPEGRLVLLGEAVATRDWTAASGQADRIAREDVFGFMLPVARAWIAQETGRGDPLRLLEGAASGSPYVAEHRALLQLARGDLRGGATAIRALSGTGVSRSARLRLIAAAALARSGDREGALSLLSGEDSATRAGRALVAAGRPIPLEVGSAAAGLAELFTRVAVDINRERVTPVSMALARSATFIDPGNAEAWLVTSALLAAEDRDIAALAALDAVKADSLFATAVADARVRLLVRQGEAEQALRLARAGAEQEGAGVADWTRVGDLYAELDRHGEAAQAYARALRLAEADGQAKADLWLLWLQHGDALEQAGDWRAAKPALEKAVALAPDEPAALNYLGYAQLEREENVAAARALIERASALRPDDAAITDSLGWAYYLTGDLPRAIETLERAAAGEPGDSEINEHLGDAYWRAGRRYEARHAWAAAQVYADEPDRVRLAAKIDGAPARP